jgi:hypothetical protein
MNYRVYQADLDRDKEVILGFWNNNHSKALDQKFHWMYMGNPAGRAVVFLLEHVESKVTVGMVAFFKRGFQIGKRFCCGGVVGDLFVDREHRTMGPALMLHRAVVSLTRAGEVELIYGFPNDVADPILKRVGYHNIGALARMVKPLKSASYLSRRNYPEVLNKLLRPLLDCCLKLTFIELFHHLNSDYAFNEVETIDDRFDHFWAECKKKYIVAGDRSASYLRWKHLKDPDDSNRVFACFNRDESAVKGYIVYRFEDRSVEVRDFVTMDDREGINALMLSFLQHIRKTPAESVIVNTMDNQSVMLMLSRFGFRRRDTRRNVYIYCSGQDPEQLRLLCDSENWFLTSSDEDT